MTDDNIGKLNKGWIEFILLAAPPDELETMAGPIFDLAIEHEAEVDMMGSLVVITYGTSGVDTGARNKRFPLIDKLKEKFRNRIKLIHGAGFGHYGFVGSRKRVRFTFLLPQFTEARACLDDLAWGEIREFPKTSCTHNNDPTT